MRESAKQKELSTSAWNAECFQSSPAHLSNFNNINDTELHCNAVRKNRNRRRFCAHELVEFPGAKKMTSAIQRPEPLSLFHFRQSYSASP